MNRLHKTILAGCFATFALSACSDKTTTYPEPPAWSMDRIQMLANGNQAEISAGALASERADSAVVRNFGEEMVMDHTDAQNKLITIVSNLNRTVTPEVDQAHKDMINHLKTLHGRAFDSTYIYMQITDHQNTIALLQSIIANPAVDAVRDYAQQTLPMVQMHLQRADSIAHNVFP